MPTLSKYNSDTYARDTLVSNGILKVFKITPTTALTADSQASEAAAITEGTIRKVAEALNPYLIQTNSGGTNALVIVDSSIGDATSIDTRLTAILNESVTVVEVTNLYGVS